MFLCKPPSLTSRSLICPDLGCDWSAGLHNQGPVFPSAATAFPSLLLREKQLINAANHQSPSDHSSSSSSQWLIDQQPLPHHHHHQKPIFLHENVFSFLFGGSGAPPAGGIMVKYSHRPAIGGAVHMFYIDGERSRENKENLQIKCGCLNFTTAAQRPLWPLLLLLLIQQRQQ